MTLDPYEELGVPRDADADAIKAAHRKGVRKHHPDAGGSQEKFGALQRSYEILADPASRARYDETGATDGPSVGQMDAAVLEGVAQIISLVVADAMDLETTNVRQILLDNLANTTASLYEAKRDVQRKIKRVEQIEKKFRRRKLKAKDAVDHESPLLRMAMRGQHDMLANELKRIEEKTAMHDRVVGVFKAFDYDFKAPASMDPGAFYTVDVRGSWNPFGQ